MHNSVASSSGAPSTAPAAAGAWPSAPHVPAQARPPFPEPEARSLYHLRPDRARDPRSHAERPLLNPYSEELNKQRQLWSGAERVALGMSLGVAGHRVSLRPQLWSYNSERELARVFDREWTWLGAWLNEANIAAWNAGCAAATSPQAPKGIRILLTREIHVALLLSDRTRHARPALQGWGEWRPWSKGPRLLLPFAC